METFSEFGGRARSESSSVSDFEPYQHESEEDNDEDYSRNVRVGGVPGEFHARCPVGFASTEVSFPFAASARN